MKNWQNTTDFLREIPLPTQTRTYKPVSHAVFIDEIKEELYKRGHSVKTERYLTANNGLIMTGNFTIENPDGEINPAIFFTNSYNKMRKAELTNGVIVLVCSNGMISMDVTNKFSKKHSGTVLEDLRNNIVLSVESIDEEFEKLRKNAEEMKQIQLSDNQIASIIGDMYINESMISETQLSILKKEVKTSTNFKDNTVWDLYNNTTEAFKASHPMHFDKQHLKLHAYVSDVFSLTGSRGLYKNKQSLIENAILV
jgi:hypothetical protein